MNQRFLTLALLSILLASCGKEDTMTIDREKYPSLPEDALEGIARTNLDSPEPTRAQLERKEKNTTAVKNLGLPVLVSLPVVEDESAIVPRSKEEIAARCLAVTICAVKGESNDQELTLDLIERFEAEKHFSPQERAFVANLKTTEQDRANFAWRYEGMHVLLWALGHIDQLQPPNEICDVVQDVRVIRELGAKGLADKAKPRALAEILDAADLYYRLHWAAIELRLEGKTSPAADEEIVMERHRALNWLIRYMGQEWDDVTTDT